MALAVDQIMLHIQQAGVEAELRRLVKTEQAQKVAMVALELLLL
jgi:hypothetical protein